MAGFSVLSSTVGRLDLVFRLMTLSLAFSTLFPGVSSMYFVSRKGWNARSPKQSYTTITNPKGVKIHYLGEAFPGVEHSQCDDKMRTIQNYHMDKSPENYFDIAYSMAVCQHGHVYDGRGAGHRSGANGGAELNANHYAVLAFIGNTGVTSPSQSQINGIQDAIAYLRRKGAGNEIKGHRDGYATQCPGGALYNLLNSGKLNPGKLYNGGTHTVKANENLDEISQKYNVPKNYIIDVNDLKSPYTVKVGQKLKIPARGVPLGSEAPGGGGGGGTTYEPFPGASWFKSKPKSSIITAMGKRLVAEGCGKYTSGPGPQWTESDRTSYAAWQKKLGYTGADADGWPGKSTWDKLKVPNS